MLADGVPLKNLYPLDVDRAFASLDRIKPYVLVWWNDGTEPVSLLLGNQVACSSAWSGRIFASEKARNEIIYSWNGAAHELDYWVIPKGSKNASKASEFILASSRPERMANQAKDIGYGPSNALALDLLESDTLVHLPTHSKNWNVSFEIDSKWWQVHEAEVKKRWIKWKKSLRVIL